MRIFRHIAYLVVVLVLLGGCKLDNEQRLPIKISITAWPGYAYAFIAEEKGFFDRNGVDVELVYRDDAAESFELYLNSQVDGFFYLLSDVLLAESEGINTKVVFVLDYSEGGDAIVGKSDFKSMEDLKGKTIGVGVIHSFSHFLVFSLMEQAGLQEGEFYLSNVPANEVLPELEKGTIDAGYTWEPTTSAALTKGYRILGTAGDVPGLIVDVLGFNAKLVEERPDDVKAIIKSLLEALDYLKSNPEEALEIMSRSEGMTKEEMFSGLQGVHLLDLQENVLAFQRSGPISLYSAAEKISHFYVQNWQIQPHLNPFNSLTNKIISWLL